MTLARGAAADFVARWDGTHWEAVGGGLRNYVAALAVVDPDGDGPQLGICMRAAASPPSATRRSIRWRGTTAPRGGRCEPARMSTARIARSATRRPSTRTAPGPAAEALYVGGSFTRAGGATANRIARWSGGTWAALSTGTNDDVRALTTFDVDADGPALTLLMVGGNFTTALGYASERIARQGLPAATLAPAITGQPQSATVLRGHAGHAERRRRRQRAVDEPLAAGRRGTAELQLPDTGPRSHHAGPGWGIRLRGEQPGEPQTLPDEIENPALGCGAGGACGAGLAGFLPATALGIGGLKLRMRRASRGG